MKLSTFNLIYTAFNEPYILKKITEYEFLPKIITSFQDYDNLYLVTNFFEGDILHNYKNEFFSEEEIKFISACIIQSLFYLREKKIINRDIRMKNLIMDHNRYLNIIDFSFSIDYKDINNSKTFIIGSKFESSPEMLNHSKYDYNSDYYRIGIIIYYLIFKKYANMDKRNIPINKYNQNYSSSCIDFINKLLIKDYKKRIGFNSINELKNHSWFRGFDWENFEKKKIISPLKFMEKKNNKIECVKHNISKENIINHKRYESNTKYIQLIKNYNYFNKDVINEIVHSLKNKF